MLFKSAITENSMVSTRGQVLTLYKKMMKESQNFTNYNFREYALFRIRDAFKEHKTESDPSKIRQFIKEAEDNYVVIKRQVIVGQLYPAQQVVIEAMDKDESQKS